jgi:hypothetical protein
MTTYVPLSRFEEPDFLRLFLPVAAGTMYSFDTESDLAVAISAQAMSKYFEPLQTLLPRTSPGTMRYGGLESR